MVDNYLGIYVVYRLYCSFIHALVIGLKYESKEQNKNGKNKPYWKLCNYLCFPLPSMTTLMMFKNVLNVDGLANEILRNLKMGKLLQISSFYWSM